MTDLYDLAFARNLSGGNAPAPVLIEKTVTANGTYSAEEDSADGYSKVTANVPNTYYAGGMLCNLTREVDRSVFLNAVSMANSVTCEICFNIGSNETNAARFITLYNGINTSVALWEYTSGVKSVDLLINDSWVLTEQNAFVIPEGVPTTISAVFTPSGWVIYLNGIAMISGSNGSSGNFSECYIGRNPTSANRTLQDTSVYSARIYNRALTASEISSNRTIDIALFGGDL